MFLSICYYVISNLLSNRWNVRSPVWYVSPKQGGRTLDCKVIKKRVNMKKDRQPIFTILNFNRGLMILLAVESQWIGSIVHGMHYRMMLRILWSKPLDEESCGVISIPWALFSIPGIMNGWMLVRINFSNPSICALISSGKQGNCCSGWLRHPVNTVPPVDIMNWSRL